MIVGSSRRITALLHHRGLSPSPAMDKFFKVSTNTCFDRLREASWMLIFNKGHPLFLLSLRNLPNGDTIRALVTLAPMRAAMRSPTSRASYSASLFVAENSKRNSMVPGVGVLLRSAGEVPQLVAGFSMNGKSAGIYPFTARAVGYKMDIYVP
ncbi:hypothetical protein Tco_0175268 [Tanacetum coccineum]